ncbi:flavin reductase family protein [Flavobacterium laiguense]|uniref:Flavin oxidoreductase n=1 Tax=Flavobacterium laiguense TaxID=2169409 RepID=A0A2U1JLF5_9FLAO|nr:flavin reductase [Flavobacterium laiguense]PWA05713.1 flavin oxidoreductase [Flavobacterium laiguense]
MKHISKETISQMERIEKLNLINSCTGFKSANLIATKSIEGYTNVAIFSSVTNLGSSPSLIGFIVRPTTAPRDTYKNIMETGFFTVNHITIDMISDAHHTSANYGSEISEFDKTNLEEEYKDGINIPFVKGSPVQLYCKFVNEYIIKENDTIHIIASIEHIFYDEILEHKDGWLQLDKGNIVALNGVDGYFLPKLIDRFQYAKQDVPTKSFNKEKE